MKNKLKFLTKISLSRKIDSKWFKIVNVILCVAILCVINIDSIINFFGGDFNKKTQILVIDKADYIYDLFNTQMEYSNNSLNQNEADFVKNATNKGNDSKYKIIKYDKSLDEAKEELKNDKKGKIILEFKESDENVLDVTMVSKEYVDISQLTVLTTSINNTKSAMAISKYNIDPTQLTQIYSGVNINREFLDESISGTNESMEVIMSSVFPIVILPFFFLSIFLIQMIGAEVNDEKTTKGMEIIISNVSPKVHLASKVISGNIFILLQSVLLIAYVGLGFVVRKYTGGNEIVNGVGTYITKVVNQIATTSFMSKLGYVIPLVIILMILTFIAYSLAAGVLASMTTNTEDFQQLQTPIIIISLVGYYLAMMAGMFKGSILIRIFSYIPFISGILSPSLLVLGQISIIDVVISIALMIGLIYWLVKYGLRIYKVGILNYSSKDIWKKMYKALKEEKD